MVLLAARKTLKCREVAGFENKNSTQHFYACGKFNSTNQPHCQEINVSFS